jgi:hypothetical protein
MIRLIINFFNSRLFKIFIRVIGSLASAILVISGYLAFLNFSSRYNRDLNTDEKAEQSELEE